MSAPTVAELHAAAEAALADAHAAYSALEAALDAPLVDGTGPTEAAARLASRVCLTLDELRATRRKLAAAVRTVTL